MGEVKRSYAKASTKSKVYSVRWDNEKLEFLQNMNKELITGQQIADYLLNKFWWDNKMPHVTAKEAPPLSLKEFDGIRPSDTKKHQLGALKSFEQWRAAKVECENDEDWEKIKAGILSATNLSTKQKDLLIG